MMIITILVFVQVIKCECRLEQGEVHLQHLRDIVMVDNTDVERDLRDIEGRQQHKALQFAEYHQITVKFEHISFINIIDCFIMIQL